MLVNEGIGVEVAVAFPSGVFVVVNVGVVEGVVVTEGTEVCVDDGMNVLVG